MSLIVSIESMSATGSLQVANKPKGNILLVANWASDVGYAWWLMESYWCVIAKDVFPRDESYLAYPAINSVPPEIEKSGIRCIEHNFRVKSIKSFIQNCRLIRKKKIEHIYLTDYPVSSFSYLLYRVIGVKTIIVHDHTPGLRTVSTGLRRLIKSIKVNFPGLSVNAAFGATSFVTKRLTQTSCLAADKCFTVQNGIKLKASDSEIESQDWLPSKNKLSIITAARANHYKGASFAVDVIKALVDKGFSDINYVFCGDGPHLEEFRTYAKKLGVERYCKFPGRVENVSSYFSAFDLGFQPSKGEVGYSLSILEYMFAGLPVIVPDNPSVCAATKHNKNGRIYKEDDIKDAANQIEFYWNNKKQISIHGEFAKNEVLSEYDIQKTHRDLITVTRSVVPKHSSGS